MRAKESLKIPKRYSESVKNGQCNDQKKNVKKTENDLQKTTRETKD